MERLKNGARNLWVFALALAVALGCALSLGAFTSEKAYADEAAVRATSTGVMKFNWSIDNNQYSRGSCFLINEDTVLTAYHCTMFNTSELQRYGYDGMSIQELRDKMTYSVTVNRDVTVSATILNYSEDQDFAILKLDQPINNHERLVLRDSTTVQAAEPAYSVGFPGNSDVGHLITTYTASDVTIKGGTVSKPETIVTLTDIIDDYSFVTSNRSGYYIQTDVNLMGGDSGGPLVDANGNVIGVSVMTIKNFSYGSATDIIMGILDDLGIKYDSVDDNGAVSTVNGTGAAANASGSSSAASSTASSTSTTASSSTTSESSSSSTGAAATTSSAAGNASGSQGLPMAAIVGIIIAIIAVIAIIVIVLVMRSRKQGAGQAPMAPLPPNAPAPAPAPVPPQAQPSLQPGQAPAAGGPTSVVETTVLGDEANDTVILFQAASGGSLTRMSTNEQIPINSAEFTIGRERSKVDYCLEGNTSISRVHVRIVVRDGKVYLIDNRAANGTFVNGVKCRPGQEVLLKAGDIITLADEKFKYNS